VKLNLSLPVTTSDIPSVLAAVYAFAPTYQFTYNATTSALETVIDASQDLTPEQLAIVSSEKYSISFVLPTPVTPVVPVTPPSS
jgi:hypothetical protein